jgi:hypothetical protein
MTMGPRTVSRDRGSPFCLDDLAGIPIPSASRDSGLFRKDDATLPC